MSEAITSTTKFDTYAPEVVVPITKDVFIAYILADQERTKDFISQMCDKSCYDATRYAKDAIADIAHWILAGNPMAKIHTDADADEESAD